MGTNVCRQWAESESGSWSLNSFKVCLPIYFSSRTRTILGTCANWIPYEKMHKIQKRLDGEEEIKRQGARQS